MITIFKYKSFPYINDDEPSHFHHIIGIAQNHNLIFKKKKSKKKWKNRK